MLPASAVMDRPASAQLAPESGQPVFLKDVWPSLQEVRDLMQAALKPEVFRELYRDFTSQNPKWKSSTPMVIGLAM